MKYCYRGRIVLGTKNSLDIIPNQDEVFRKAGFETMRMNQTNFIPPICRAWMVKFTCRDTVEEAIKDVMDFQSKIDKKAPFLIQSLFKEADGLQTFATKLQGYCGSVTYRVLDGSWLIDCGVLIQRDLEIDPECV